MILTNLVILLTTLNLFANTSWLSLNAEANKHCSAQAPCSLVQKGEAVPFQIVIKTQVVGKKKNKLQTNAVVIRHGKKSTKYSELDNFALTFKSETYGVFSEDINGDGFLDLAIKASNSLKDGPNYFYWIYSPKTKAFVQTKEQLPGLRYAGKNIMASLTTEQKYSLNSDNQITPIQ